jgi:hypothetical protein
MGPHFTSGHKRHISAATVNTFATHHSQEMCIFLQYSQRLPERPCPSERLCFSSERMAWDCSPFPLPVGFLEFFCRTQMCLAANCVMRSSLLEASRRSEINRHNNMTLTAVLCDVDMKNSLLQHFLPLPQP